jgi:predicted nuclease of predicted toxin-antitoxin system
VRFLVDQNLSPEVAALLRAAGHEAVHTRELGMQSASDTDIVKHAVAENLVILSADTDFGTLLALSSATEPSVVLIRRSQDRRAAALVGLVLANLPFCDDALACGAIVVLEQSRLRVRRLPLR